MREVVICEPVRTPIGRFGGVFRDVDVVTLGVVAMKGLLERTGLDPAVIDDVILGHCNPSSDAPALGRVVALDAGLPTSVPGTVLDRRCGSGLQAVLNAAMEVQTGVCDVVVAGGAESMSNAPFFSTDMRWGARGSVTLHDGLERSRVMCGGKSHPIAGGMLETAENVRRQYGIGREEQDALSVESHRRATEAQAKGFLAEEIVEVTVPGPNGPSVVALDEHIRPDTTMESLRKLKPMLAGVDPDATVTAGNASGQNDAAALCVVTTPERAAELGLEPLVRLVSWAVSGVDPEMMGIGPVPATRAALGRVRLTLAEMDVIELNEAFACQVLAVMQEWGFGDDDRERVNIHGSGISLGHPVGATGARMLNALTRELRRSDGRYGLETMCLGGGQGLAAVFENVT